MNQPLELDGTLNFRDVGGVPCGPDRRVAHGRLLRSDTLQFLTADAIHALVTQLGLRSDIDLRLDFEVEVEGRGLLADEPSIAHVHMPFMVEGANRDGSATPILQQDDPVVTHYLGYLESSAPSVVGIVRLLGSPEGPPAIIHCAAGKDRTGVAIAMVLAAVGCDENDIADEYAAGSHLVDAVLARLRGMPSYGPALDKLPKEANLTPPEYIHRFFAGVRTVYGSPREYLMLHGVTEAELVALKENLTEPIS